VSTCGLAAGYFAQALGPCHRGPERFPTVVDIAIGG
jgi:hypothetical protein